MDTRLANWLLTVVAAGLILALLCGILYALDLVILSEETIAWLLLVSLCSAAAALFAMILKGIWTDEP